MGQGRIMRNVEEPDLAAGQLGSWTKCVLTIEALFFLGVRRFSGLNTLVFVHRRCGNQTNQRECSTTDEPRDSDDNVLCAVREFGAGRTGRGPLRERGAARYMASNGTGTGASSPTRLATRLA